MWIKNIKDNKERLKDFRERCIELIKKAMWGEDINNYNTVVNTFNFNKLCCRKQLDLQESSDEETANILSEEEHILQRRKKLCFESRKSHFKCM